VLHVLHVSVLMCIGVVMHCLSQCSYCTTEQVGWLTIYVWVFGFVLVAGNPHTGTVATPSVSPKHRLKTAWSAST